MPRILITAFEPYDIWQQNASWLALVEFTKEKPAGADVATRLYPVNFAAMRQRLEADLDAGYDVAIHLGQAPGTAAIHLEAIGLNVGGNSEAPAEEYQRLVNDGPVAYRSQLPLDQWVQLLRHAQIPATISYHAGTYLCNAILYLSHYLCEQRALPTQSAFVHLPLTPCQAVGLRREMPCLPAATAAQGLKLMVDALIKREPFPDQELA